MHVLGRIKTQQKQAAAAAVASDKSSSSSNSNNDRATKAPQPLTSSSSENQCFISASFINSERRVHVYDVFLGQSYETF